MIRATTPVLAFCLVVPLLSPVKKSFGWQGSPAPQAASAPIAYESATLPQDSVQAWQMLRAATGLGDTTLQPWSLHAHYKTYDVYGKPKGEGTLEYIWANSHRWHYTFTEGGLIFTRWKTENGIYNTPGQPEALPYPTDLILRQLLHPLGNSEADRTTPSLFTKEKFATTTLSCFAVKPHPENVTSKESDLKRACTVPDKPFLFSRQGDYNVFFEGDVAFQHRIVAKRILIKDGPDEVVHVDLDMLGSPTTAEMQSLDPPIDANFRPDNPPTVPISVVAGHILKKVDPFYPTSAKLKRIQGTVRFAAVIDAEGKIKSLKVLHSPDFDLTFSAEEAVKQWTYTPYVVDGKPTEVNTQIKVGFTLDR